MLPDQKDMRTSDRGTSTTSKGGVITWTPSKIESERLLELKKVPTFDPKAPYGYNVDQVLEHINKLMACGADKIALNYAAIYSSDLITKAANKSHKKKGGRKSKKRKSKKCKCNKRKSKKR